MVAWSAIGVKNLAKLNTARSLLPVSKNGLSGKVMNYIQVRSSGHDRTMIIRTSNYQYKKMKDMMNFYLLIGIIPLGLLIAYVNIFIGPATLALIPEGYEPKHWEYHRHPITRFIARYIMASPQEVHERTMHVRFLKKENRDINLLETMVKRVMKDKEDYQAWYFHKPGVNYVRKTYQIIEEGKSTRGGLETSLQV